MKQFQSVSFDPVQCGQDLRDYRAFLDGKRDLEENADVKPFFEARPHLAAFLGSYHWNIARYDRLAFQFQLFGDFSCDLAVGDSARATYGFIEWEDGTADGLFRRQGKKATPEWSARFERGFSQVVDWFCKLDDMSRTDAFEILFGDRHIQYFGMLVVGRDEGLTDPRERRRWEWRQQKVLVNSHPVKCVTYDQLYRFLFEKLNVFYPLVGEAAAAP